MPILYADMVDGSGVEQTSEGYVATRIMLLDQCTGNADAVLYNAIALNPNLVPKRGTYHPSIPNLALDTIRGDPIQGQPTQVKVTLVYRQVNVKMIPDDSKPGEMSVGSTVQTVQTNMDKDGNLMTVGYTSTDPVTNAETTDTQTGSVEKQVPQTVVRFTRREKLNPLQKSILYTGTINKVPFLGDPPGFWMCTRLEGTTSDGSVSFTVEYEFQRNSANWMQTTIAYIDPVTSLVPQDATFANGLERYELFDQQDFNQLRLK